VTERKFGSSIKFLWKKKKPKTKKTPKAIKLLYSACDVTAWASFPNKIPLCDSSSYVIDSNALLPSFFPVFCSAIIICMLPGSKVTKEHNNDVVRSCIDGWINSLKQTYNNNNIRNNS
jgi:hypothetical protein